MAPDEWTEVVHTIAGRGALVGGLLPWRSGYLAWGNNYDGEALAWSSADGLTWRSGSAPAGDVQQIAASGELLIGVGFDSASWERSTVWTSSDAAAWGEVLDPGIFQGVVLQGVIGWSGGAIAWGWEGDPGTCEYFGWCESRHGVIFTSADGLAWQRSPSGDAFHGSDINSIAAGASGLVAVGEVASGTTPGQNAPTGAVAWFSDDGQQWQTLPQSPAFEDAAMRHVVAYEDGFIATGTSLDQRTVAVWRSTDGRDWQRLPAQPAFLESEVQGLAVVAGEVVAVGQDLFQSYGSAMWSSADGATWHRLPTTKSLERAHLTAIAAGGEGIIVAGDRATFDDWTAAAVIMTAPVGPFVGATADPTIPNPPALGYRWTRVPNLAELTRGGGVGSASSGSAGVVMVGQDGQDGRPFTLVSPDGVTWTRTDLAAEAFGGGIPGQIVPGGPGYVALGYEVSLSRGVEPVAWLSDDGTKWLADPSPTGWFRGQMGQPYGGATLIATSQGLVSVGRHSDGSTMVAVSADGIAWEQVADLPFDPLWNAYGGPGGVVVQSDLAHWYSSDGRSWAETQSTLGVYVIGDDAILSYESGGLSARHLWIASDGPASWRLLDQQRIFDYSELGHIFARPGGGFVAFGEVLTWTGFSQPNEAWISEDGDTWVRQALDPAVWGRSVILSMNWIADTPVVLGADGATQQPIVWVGTPVTHRDVPPVVASVPLPAPGPAPSEPPPGACPVRPANVADLMALGPVDGPRCFGARDITLTAWYAGHASCDYGFSVAPAPPEPSDALFQPGWLSGEGCEWDWIKPSRRSSDDELFSIYVDRSRVAEPSRQGYERITGHFDDPESAGCGAWVPGVGVQYQPQEALVNECRTHFVVTRFRPSTGP